MKDLDVLDILEMDKSIRKFDEVDVNGNRYYAVDFNLSELMLWNIVHDDVIVRPDFSDSKYNYITLCINGGVNIRIAVTMED